MCNFDDRYTSNNSKYVKWRVMMLLQARRNRSPLLSLWFSKQMIMSVRAGKLLITVNGNWQLELIVYGHPNWLAR
jgi:hypothetical protein